MFRSLISFFAFASLVDSFISSGKFCKFARKSKSNARIFCPNSLWILANSKKLGSTNGCENCTLTEMLVTENSPLIEQITAHPFIVELTKGTLSLNRFQHFIIQDLHYLCMFLLLIRAKIFKNIYFPKSGLSKIFKYIFSWTWNVCALKLINNIFLAYRDSWFKSYIGMLLICLWRSKHILSFLNI